MPVRKNLYELSLHEATVQGVYRIIRVPGGWIYERQTKRISDSEREVQVVFVPFNGEFDAPSE